MNTILKDKSTQHLINKWFVVYLWFFFVYTLCSRIVPIGQLMQGTINQLIFIFLALGGAVFLVLDFFGQQLMFKTKDSQLLICFIIVMCISSLLKLNYGFYDNFKTIVWTTIQFLLIYSLEKRGTSLEKYKCLRLFIYSLTIILGLAVIVSLIQYGLQIGYKVFYINRDYRQGFYDHRLFGVFIDPNYAAATSLVSLYGSLYLVFKEKNLKWRIVSLVNVFIQLAYIVLSGSRSVLIAYVIGMSLFVFLLVRRYMLIHYDREERPIFSLFGIVLALLISFGSYYSTKMVWEAVPKILHTTNNSEVLDREDVSESNISNNRFMIWEGYIKGTIETDNVFFGLSPRNAVAYLQQNQPSNYIATTEYETHNAYVSIFAFTGLVGTIVMLFFIIRSIKNVINHVFILKDYTVEYTVCLSIEGGLAIYAFFITDLFFMNNISTLIFWAMLGYINNFRSRRELWQK